MTDHDLATLSHDAALAEIVRLRAAIRKHRDHVGAERTWLDDAALYAALPERRAAETQLPPRAEYLAQCAAYYDARQGLALDPATPWSLPDDVDVQTFLIRGSRVFVHGPYKGRDDADTGEPWMVSQAEQDYGGKRAEYQVPDIGAALTLARQLAATEDCHICRRPRREFGCIAGLWGSKPACGRPGGQRLPLRLTPSEEQAVRARPLSPLVVVRLVENPPEQRWHHFGGRRFCRGEHEKGASCEDHAFEFPCPWGPERAEIPLVAETLAPIATARRTLATIQLSKTEQGWFWTLVLNPLPTL